MWAMKWAFRSKMELLFLKTCEATRGTNLYSSDVGIILNTTKGEIYP